eukprot:COSAG02_NODE_44860_length_362_cov_0.851711_2_plen_34_part_01
MPFQNDLPIATSYHMKLSIYERANWLQVSGKVST